MDSVSAGTPQGAGLFLSCCGDGWGETCPPGDERHVAAAASNDRGKGRPVSLLQGFTLDEGKSVKSCRDSETQTEFPVCQHFGVEGNSSATIGWTEMWLSYSWFTEDEDD